MLVISLEGIAVDNLDIGGVDWFCVGGYDKKQHRDTG
jgi:hypothetical protein